MTPIIEIKNIYAGYTNTETGDVLVDLNLKINKEEIWGIIGKNGTGKSTIIKILAGLIKPNSGTVNLNGKPLQNYTAKQRANLIGYVPQNLESPIPYSVTDFVMLGRYSKIGLWGIPTNKDKKAVEKALEFCDITHLSNRLMTTLSGGELQRVLLAGALAQETSIILLDEPTTFLDPAHERLFFDALNRAKEHKKLTIIMVTHDINTAIGFATNICALKNKNICFKDSVKEFGNQCPNILSEIYGIPFTRYLPQNTNLHPVYGSWNT